ncbi:TolB-like translocation protein [Methanogenium organophilum]|uniref:Uncharacterized protein n=1 Tax=Methanogenium organophilum TaxID=2199 RepID=A0A9X9T6Y3_METOG|nr:hypothetical protein [Methanogenium organophilum]WAI00459.1 hypothetical protein OU421_08460 [Methanogenium organophilum]
MLLSLCILGPAASAVGISGEKKTIFTAEEGAYISSAIDSGNILICEVYPDPDKDDASSWSRLYLYNISEGTPEELLIHPSPSLSLYHHLDINENIVVWVAKSERDWVEGQFDVYAYNLDERKSPERIAEKFYSVNGIAKCNDKIIITGRNSATETRDYDHGEIFVYNLVEGSLTKYELPGCQSWVAVSGKNLIFQDTRYGQLKNTVHLMNFDTGKTRQIGDENKGVYSNPDISGEKIVYKFDENFGSFLKDNPPQKVLMTDIFTNEMTIIASPDAQVASPKIDGNNIVWADKRNRVYYSVRLYNINEEYEILISDTNGTSGGSVEISGDSVIWKDLVNGRNVLKLIKLDLPKTSATLTEIQQTIEKGVAETDNGENSTQTAGLFWGFSFAGVIFGLCFISRRNIVIEN